MPAHLLILIAGWIFWCAPFLLVRRHRKRTAARIDSRARWGIVLQGLGFGLLWQSSFRRMDPLIWRMVLGAVCMAVAGLLSWTATRALGRQWRIDAGLNPDHELIRSGPYSLVRHPIYTSMLFLLLGAGLLISPWLQFALAIAAFTIGTAIRVRIEDGLLASRFGEEFQEYRRSVPPVLPGVRL